MAIESLTTDPEMHGAEPCKGNYTTEASTHLRCASALAHVVANDQTFGLWNADIKEALRWLLACEIDRAMKAEAAEGRGV